MDTDTRHRISEFLRDNPIAFAAFRVFHNQSNGYPMSDSDEIPFITSILFLPVIITYILVKRIRRPFLIYNGTTGTVNHGPPDHVFVMSSQSQYRTHSFIQIAESFQNQGDTVRLLCSPDAEPMMSTWEQDSLETVAHRELHGTIPILDLLKSVPLAIDQVLKCREQVPYENKKHDLVLAFNYTLLEHIKSLSTRSIFTDDSTVHTYAPMPYIVQNANTDLIYVYQHGIQWRPDTNILMAAPFYIPLTYFVWSDTWIDNFELATHPDSEIIPVGSPWYDYLSEASSTERQNTEFDVLFISNSQGCSTAAQKDKYETLVRSIVSACQSNSWKLAIKLHPVENPYWYDQRGLSQYIHEFEDIETALSSTQISITDNSSAFIESAVLGTPVIVTDVFDTGLSKLSPVKNVKFVQDHKSIETAISSVLSKNSVNNISNSVVRLGGSIDRIVIKTNADRMTMSNYHSRLDCCVE